MARQSALPWMSLPAEIRCMILETIAEQKHPGWASFASVCKEWRHVLEEANFCKMRLNVPCLDDFESIMSASPHKRALVRHICLDVELPRYTRQCCSRRRKTSYSPGSIVSPAIWKLFSILSAWAPAEHLALEINAYSPSDREHWFRHIHLPSDDGEHGEDALSDEQKAMLVYHDPRHGWSHGRQVQAPPGSAIQHLFRPIHLSFPNELPQVQAVTSLIVRRQVRRSFYLNSFCKAFQSLVRLEHIVLEPWAPRYREYIETPYNLSIYYAMQDRIPATVKRFIIFEDAYASYDAFPRQRVNQLSSHIFSTALPLLFDQNKRPSALFAAKSVDFQHMAIAFMVRAEELFQHCRPTWSWPHLQSLALTSPLLRPDWDNCEPIEQLLGRAGVLVRQMPSLHTLVLWNGARGHACAFIFRIDKERASITWRGTWSFDLGPHVVKSWQAAASSLHNPVLQVKQEHIQGAVLSPGDAIHHLDLPCQVIEPASLWQIRRESYSIWQ